jgi:hypothetical protein
LDSIALDEQAWINAYRAENKKYFEAILTNQKLSEQESEQLRKQRKVVPKRQTLNKFNFANNNESSKNPKLVDGFFLVCGSSFWQFSFDSQTIIFFLSLLKMQTFCVEDPLDLTTVDISYKGLNQVCL